MPTLGDLRQKQSLPLEAKIVMSQQRIREFFDATEGKVYISFSGGKDSTVLAHLVRSVYPNVPIIYMDTGLEFPESRKISKDLGAEILRPQRSFVEILTKYGYPVITKEISESIYYARRIINGSKVNKLFRTTMNKRRELLGKRMFVDDRQGLAMQSSRFNKTKWLPLANDTDFMISNRCCFYMKKSDFGKLSRERDIFPYIGTTTDESVLRQESWLRYGCNTFHEGKAASRPISFWKEQDILQYLHKFKLEYNPVYGDIVKNEKTGLFETTGQKRTGCLFCAFGVNYAVGPSKFEELKKTHPRQYEYCMEGGQYIPNPHYDPAAPVMDGEWTNWNPKKIWVPSKKGIGMKHVFDQMNEIYGKYFIRY